jgi:hypothetical protein
MKCYECPMIEYHEGVWSCKNPIAKRGVSPYGSPDNRCIGVTLSLEKVSPSIVIWSVIGLDEGAIDEVIVSIPVPDASEEAIEVIWNTPKKSGWTRSLDTGSTYWFWTENGNVKSESPAARFGSFCKHQLAIAQAMGVM